MDEKERLQQERHKQRIKIINLISRKPEIKKICVICKKPGKIMHNKDNPYFISFICDECRKNKENIKKAEEMRFDVRDYLVKDTLSVNNFSEKEIYDLVQNYLKAYTSIGDYCKKEGISRYQFNEIIRRYNKFYPKENIVQRVKNRSRKIQSEKLKKITQEKQLH